MCLRSILSCFFTTHINKFKFSIEKINCKVDDICSSSFLENDIKGLSFAYESIFLELYNIKNPTDSQKIYEVYNKDPNAFKYSTNFRLWDKQFKRGASCFYDTKAEKNNFLVKIIFNSDTLVTSDRICLAKFIWIVGRCIRSNWSNLKKIEQLITSYEDSTFIDSNILTCIEKLKTFLKFLKSAKENKKLKTIDKIIKDVILSYLKHSNVSNKTLMEFKKLKFKFIFKCSEEVMDIIKGLDFRDLITSIFDESEQAFLKFCE